MSTSDRTLPDAIESIRDLLDGKQHSFCSGKGEFAISGEEGIGRWGTCAGCHGTGLDPGSCWNWTGQLSQHGYGRARFEGKRWYVHRYVYEKLVGPVPEGKEPDHLCRNRTCANPNHLEMVTHRENVLRGVGPTAQNVKKTHCVQGHPFDEANVIVRSLGWRGCRICQRAARLKSDRGRVDVRRERNARIRQERIREAQR